MSARTRTTVEAEATVEHFVDIKADEDYTETQVICTPSQAIELADEMERILRGFGYEDVKVDINTYDDQNGIQVIGPDADIAEAASQLIFSEGFVDQK